MKVREVRVSIRYVKNLGNYQSFTAEAGATIEVELGESPEDVFAEGWTLAKSQVSDQVKNLKTKEVV